MIMDLLPLYLSIALFVIVTLYLGIYLVKNKAMFLVIPLLIGATITSYYSVDRLLGYPVHEDLKEEVFYITHIPRENDMILWVLYPDEELPKAIIVPATDKQKKNAQGAQERQQEGIPQVIRRPDHNVENWEFYDFLPIDDPNLKGS